MRTHRTNESARFVATILLTTFACMAPVPTFANVVLNGDFENPGLAGINSDYVHTPQGNTDEGTWWVNPWDPGGPWFGVQHTPGGVAAMSVTTSCSTTSR